MVSATQFALHLLPTRLAIGGSENSQSRGNLKADGYKRRIFCLFLLPHIIRYQGVILLLNLSPNQARVIGVMLEKEVTTPEHYPLSLNGLTNACNQKSNREPVMELSASQVQETVDELSEKKLILEQSGNSSRVSKYQHRFCNTQFSDLQLSKQQVAIICVLLLRGPQTPGELRTRTQRLAQFTHAQELEGVLTSLQDIKGEQLIVRLEREPGKREARYSQLFCPMHNTAVEQIAPIAKSTAAFSREPEDINNLGRIEVLETQVADLCSQLQELREMVNKQHR
ncbi:MAG: hypothetical protein ACJA13_003225 [Paraglaciecola sp.]|jgi:uncharacterized protein YceH (UPF0502 family)